MQGDPLFVAFQQGLLSDVGFGILLSYLQQEKLADYHLIPDPLLNNLQDVVEWAKVNGGSRFTVAAMS
ncbi:hypothetical protein, partial [Pseudomonas sp. FW306-02-F04-BA]|uniref:hypothetical protein n=1 Tax=Pseudomonas sp. FW306-02-F04-BA TaxID=2070655 RepID=UPI001C4654AF